MPEARSRSTAVERICPTSTLVGQITTRVEDGGGLSGGLEGEPAHNPIGGHLRCPAGLFKVPGAVFDGPGEIQDGLAEQTRRGLTVPHQADCCARQHAGVAHGEVQRISGLGVGREAPESAPPGRGEPGRLVAGVQSLPQTSRPRNDLACLPERSLRSVGVPRR